MHVQCLLRSGCSGVAWLHSACFFRVAFRLHYTKLDALQGLVRGPDIIEAIVGRLAVAHAQHGGRPPAGLPVRMTHDSACAFGHQSSRHLQEIGVIQLFPPSRLSLRWPKALPSFTSSHLATRLYIGDCLGQAPHRSSWCIAHHHRSRS